MDDETRMAARLTKYLNSPYAKYLKWLTAREILRELGYKVTDANADAIARCLCATDLECRPETLDTPALWHFRTRRYPMGKRG